MYSAKFKSHIFSVISLYILLIAKVCGIFNKCPQVLSKIPDICNTIQCENSLSKHGCPSNSIYVNNFTFCECCPACVRYRRPGENCVPEDSPMVEWKLDSNCGYDEAVCTVLVNTCLPGFNCNSSTGLCDFPTALPSRDKGECKFRKSLRQLTTNTNTKYVHWDPECDADGSFSPKQCKGSLYDGECFCVDREGKRIFGREWRIKAENQTCACSRKVHELRKTHRLTASFHCTPDGNFEPLQCDTDSGLCYCVDPKTGELDGAVLPESQWKFLPCFSLNLTDQKADGKYLRKCESEFAGIDQLRTIGREHGLDFESNVLNCDFDGSYSPVQIVHTRSQCVFKNGTRIKDYFMPANINMTCNCARDKEEYLPSLEKFFAFDCEQQTGNYEPVYDFGSKASCVDKDGFLYGDIVPSKYFCCLLNEGCAPKIKKECYEKDENPNGIKPCSYWWYRY